MPNGRSYASGRGTQKEEIVDLLTYPDRAIKPAVLVLASSEIRMGASII
jgi:hypothetical protein